MTSPLILSVTFGNIIHDRTMRVRTRSTEETMELHNLRHLIPHDESRYPGNFHCDGAMSRFLRFSL